MTQQVPLLINGEFVQSESQNFIPVTNPATQEVIAQVPCATEAEVEGAVEAAKTAFETWKETPVGERARLMLRYQALLKENHDEIATILSQETGKTFEDAKGDVWRGIEVVEHACNIASLSMGETVENVARKIDCYSITQPLGVCVGITPFNFPAMIPLWMFPMAIACGNTFVLKPSEQDPLTPMRLAELFQEAGAPAGLLQVVHGTKDAVNQLLTHKDTPAISFVGSVAVGEHIYRTGTDKMKRVQAFAGAKNHMVIMPDAAKNQVVNSIAGASVGAAGQRCMAISVAVFVGESRKWIPEVRDALAKVRPGAWDDPEAGYGPQINPQARDKVLGFIQQGKDAGAECILDGSDVVVEGYPDGNWVGPTMFRGVTTEMSIYQEEIFGPVLSALEVATF
ncbi:MAG: CoA-acylating methylmalonate-semialdehyde dehydrogenase, partial [Oceanospirillaceae bacterium]|nr:CoA-acylating methylmalonate-semialdehyde dehydrogenase [Oceanospirillaceae bacterium]